MAAKKKKAPAPQGILDTLLKNMTEAAPHVGAAISGAAQGMRIQDERSRMAFAIFINLVPHWTDSHGYTAAATAFKAADDFIEERNKQAGKNSPPPPSIPPMQ